MKEKIDFFSLPMYNFHFNDSMTVASNCGVCISILIVVTVFIVAFGTIVQYSAKSANYFSTYNNLDIGYYDDSIEYEALNFAVGLAYKQEYQTELNEFNFDAQTFYEGKVQNLVKIEMSIRQ